MISKLLINTFLFFSIIKYAMAEDLSDLDVSSCATPEVAERVVDLVEENSKYLPILYLLKEECLEKVFGEMTELRPQVSGALGVFQAVRFDLEAQVFVEEVAKLLANGSRYAFQNQTELFRIQSNDKLVAKELEAFIETSLPGFLLEDKAENMNALTKWLNYFPLKIDANNDLRFQQYCSETSNCKLPEYTCPLEYPLGAKLAFLNNEELLFEKIATSCHYPSIVIVQSLRSMGILDGYCSLPLQTLAFDNFNSLERSRCSYALRKIPSFGLITLIDQIALLRHISHSNAAPFEDSILFYGQEFTEIVNFLQKVKAHE